MDMNWNTNSHAWGFDPSYRAPPQARPAQLKVMDNPVTQEIALDCEMVEATVNRRRFSVLARVSVVNSDCQPLLDTYVDPMYYVSDYRTPYSGIRPEHLENAPTYESVRDCVINLVENRTIIGHDLKQDLAVLGIKNLQSFRLRDTSRCYMSYFKPNEKPSLKRLAAAVLGEQIQIGSHDSMEDAKAAMRLYLHWLSDLSKNEEDAMPIETNNNNHNHTTSNNSNNYRNRNSTNSSNHNHPQHHNHNNSSNYRNRGRGNIRYT